MTLITEGVKMKECYVNFFLFVFLITVSACQVERQELQFKNFDQYALISSSPGFKDRPTVNDLRQVDPLCNIKVALQDKLSYTALPHIFGSNMISLGSSQFGPVETKEEFFNTSYEHMLNRMRSVSNAHSIRADADFHIIADLERPFHPRDMAAMYKRYIEDADQEIIQLATALKLRIQAMREIFPNAKLSLYGYPLNRTLDEEDYAALMMGMSFLGALGVFDQVDYLLPVIYFRFGPTDLKGDRKYLNRTLLSSKLIRNSQGQNLSILPLLSFYIHNASSNHHLEKASLDQFTEAIGNIKLLQGELDIDGIAIWNDSLNVDVISLLNQMTVPLSHCQKEKKAPLGNGILHQLAGFPKTLSNPRGLVYNALTPNQLESYVDSLFLRALQRGSKKIFFSMPNGWQGLSQKGADQVFGEDVYDNDPNHEIPSFHEVLRRKIKVFKQVSPHTILGVHLSAQIPFARSINNCSIESLCPYRFYSASLEDKIYFHKLISSWYHGPGVREFIFDNSSQAIYLPFHFELMTWLQNHFPDANFHFESYPGLELNPGHPYHFSSIQNYFGATSSISEVINIVEGRSISTGSQNIKYLILDEYTPAHITKEVAQELFCDGYTLLSAAFQYDHLLDHESCD